MYAFLKSNTSIKFCIAVIHFMKAQNKHIYEAYIIVCLQCITDYTNLQYEYIYILLILGS